MGDNEPINEDFDESVHQVRLQLNFRGHIQSNESEFDIECSSE